MTRLGRSTRPTCRILRDKVEARYPVPGDGGFDDVTLDGATRRLYLSHATQVDVVDADTGTLVGTIPDTPGVHGLLWLGRSNTVIEPRAGQLVTNISLGGKPEYGASANDGSVYVNLTHTSEVVEIDAEKLTVTRRWSTAPCKQPVAMAIDLDHHRLFSGCRSDVMAISDYRSGKVASTVPIGDRVDGTAYDPATGDAFASNADGTLTVIHQDDPDTYHVVEQVQTALAARNMGLDPTTHRVYVVSAKFGPASAEPTAANPRRRPSVIQGSFMMMVIERAPGGR